METGIHELKPLPYKDLVFHPSAFYTNYEIVCTATRFYNKAQRRTAHAGLAKWKGCTPTVFHKIHPFYCATPLG